MDSDSSYRKWDSMEAVQLSLPEASSAKRGGKALCFPDSSHGKAIAILYVLLTLCFVTFTALVAVRLGNQSQALGKSPPAPGTVSRAAESNLSALQHYLELKMSEEVGRLSSQLLQVTEELAGLRLGMEKIQGDQVKDPTVLQEATEVRNLTHSLSQELAEMQEAHGRLQTAVSRLQEEIRNISGLICTACPSGWEGFENNCYFFSTRSKTWEQAKEACVEQESHLVIISTVLEQVFLAAHVGQPHLYWLGLTDSATEGEWHWVDGSPLTVRFWTPGEPNNVGQFGEDCGILSNNGKWNDVHCSEDKMWICERPC